MKKAIILDCDGVLRSFSWQGVYSAYCVIGEYFGIDFTKICPDVTIMKSKYSHDWQRNLKMMGIHDVAHYPKVNEIFWDEYFTTVKMFAWVPEILEQLTCDHIVTIYSNSAAESVIDSLGNAAENCAMILGHAEVKNLKPAPDGILKIMKTFNLDSSQTIMVGDADVDIAAGKNAGVTTALVTWGAVDSQKEIDALAACKILHNPGDLLTLFD